MKVVIKTVKYAYNYYTDALIILDAFPTSKVVRNPSNRNAYILPAIRHLKIKKKPWFGGTQSSASWFGGNTTSFASRRRDPDLPNEDLICTINNEIGLSLAEPASPAQRSAAVEGLKREWILNAVCTQPSHNLPSKPTGGGENPDWTADGGKP